MDSQREIDKVRRAIGDRGACLLYIYRQLQGAGVKNAKDLLCQAISAWGKSKADAAPVSTPCAYIQKLEGGNRAEIYQRHVIQSDGQLALMEMGFCPLLAAWQQAGSTPEELRDLCDIASEGDYASAGENLRLTFDCRMADGANCCLMRVVPQP